MRPTNDMIQQSNKYELIKKDTISNAQELAHKKLNTMHRAHQITDGLTFDSQCAICQYVGGLLFMRDDAHANAIRSLISQPDSVAEWTLIVKNT
jgi:hypothetical protein